jgi:BirA family biotin operon repressor/biotin-[acetyl-CoA-carboxylase] ligase
MLSLLVRPTVDQASWGWLPLITALAITDGLQQVGVTAAIKWPNDVVVAQAKLAGILCEVVPTPEGSAVVVGWGVNVDQEESELPNPEATSVRLQHGAVDRAALLVSCLSSWEHRYREWATSTVGRDALSALYAQRSSTLGRPVTATLPGGEVLTGTALRLDPHGHLVVDVRGQERVVPAADVVHLRAAGLSP